MFNGFGIFKWLVHFLSMVSKPWNDLESDPLLDRQLHYESDDPQLIDLRLPLSFNSK
jgi:hypothetical protein